MSLAEWSKSIMAISVGMMVLSKLKFKRVFLEEMCVCGHKFTDHYDNGLDRKGLCHGECLHEIQNGRYCECKFFKHICEAKRERDALMKKVVNVKIYDEAF